MREKLTDILGEAAGMLGGGLLLGSCGTAIFGLYFWLRFGQWAAFTVAQTSSYFGWETWPVFTQTGWAGIDRLVSKANHLADLYGATNIGWTLLLLGFLTFMFAQYLEELNSRLAKVEKQLQRGGQ